MKTPIENRPAAAPDTLELPRTAEAAVSLSTAEPLPAVERLSAAETELVIEPPFAAGLRLAGRPVDLRANLDGPWPRSALELTREINTLIEVDAAVKRVLGPDPGPMLPPEAYLQGVWSAACWCVTDVQQTPMTTTDLPVTDASVAAELALAREVVAEPDPVLAAYSGGVLAWFGWLALAEDTIPYPPREAF